MIFNFLSKKTGIPLQDVDDSLRFEEMSSAFFNTTLENREIVDLLNQKNYKALKGHIHRVENEGEATGLSLFDMVYTRIYQSRGFKRFIRSELDINSHESVVIARTSRSYYRYYDHSSYDIETDHYYVLLRPDNTYIEVYKGKDFSITMDRD
jgi:hypothetical protein